jgi:hypothetical protein
MKVEDNAITEEELRVVPIREMILHILRIYPTVSPTMMQNTLGPWLKATRWRPILDDLINEGAVDLTTTSVLTPYGRYNTYKKLQFTERGHELYGKVPDEQITTDGQQAG